MRDIVIWSLVGLTLFFLFATIPLIYIGLMKDTKNEIRRRGQVTEALPSALFRVVLDDTEEEMLAYLAGKMRMYKIKVLVGDKVEVIVDKYGGRARIVRRF